jgi:hypothetical protein
LGHIGVLHESDGGGNADTLYRKAVRNYPVVKLSSASSSLLSANPDIFVMAYGIHYIAEVVYGGSFLGYQNLAQSHEYGQDALNVFAKLDINETMFTAGGSENFTQTHSKLSDSVKLTFNMATRGGPPLNGTGQTPYEMGQAFQAWSKGLSEQETSLATGMKMVWRNWYDL